MDRDTDQGRRAKLMTFPVDLGKGRRLFAETTAKKPLWLVDSKVVRDGIVVLTYETVI